ncbi:MAG: phage tail sheath C-terminal domain-containing protein [Bacteroidota bacterium]
MQYKTPGVYVEEISIFPPSVASVETAIPAFIGFTEKALDTDGRSLDNIPTKIDSLVEYEQYFGGAYRPLAYTATLDSQGAVSSIAVAKFYLYKSLQLYFANGGGPCYIVSIGSYGSSFTLTPFNNGLNALIKYDEPTLILFPDAVGRAVDNTALTATFLGTLQANTLAQCAKLQDRFGVFDVLDGYQDGVTQTDAFRSEIGINNLKYGAAYHPFLNSNLPVDIPLRLIIDAGAPPNSVVLNNTFPSDSDMEALRAEMEATVNQTDATQLTNVNYYESLNLKEEFNASVITVKASTDDTIQGAAFSDAMNILRQVVLGFQAVEGAGSNRANVQSLVDGFVLDSDLLDAISDLLAVEVHSTLTAAVEVAGGAATFYGALDNTDWIGGGTVGAIMEDAIFDLAPISEDVAQRAFFINYVTTNVEVDRILDAYQQLVNQAVLEEGVAEAQLLAGFPAFAGIKKAVEKEMRLVPPSGAIVGVYAKVDNTRGVWKAPANVGLVGVVGPSVKLTNTDQDDLNVDTTAGKSINAIRSFTGKGTLVWGARTLAGNDNEWRYISVRRFFNMVEESVKKASGQFVFEPNDANTWVKIRSMISNYLTTLWRQGALAGPTPDAAFFVKVGLGETMTSQDILEGRMIIEIGMAAVRPAEFIILKFSHKMQEA